MLSLSDKEEIDNMDIVKMGYVLNGILIVMIKLTSLMMP